MRDRLRSECCGRSWVILTHLRAICSRLRATSGVVSLLALCPASRRRRGPCLRYAQISFSREPFMWLAAMSNAIFKIAIPLW